MKSGKCDPLMAMLNGVFTGTAFQCEYLGGTTRLCQAQDFGGISCTGQKIVWQLAIFELGGINEGYVLLCHQVLLVKPHIYCACALCSVLPAARRIEGNRELLPRALQDTRRRL